MQKPRTLSETEYKAWEALYSERNKVMRDMQVYKEKCRTGVINDSLAVKIEKQSFFKAAIKELDGKLAAIGWDAE